MGSLFNRHTPFSHLQNTYKCRPDTADAPCRLDRLTDPVKVHGFLHHHFHPLHLPRLAWHLIADRSRPLMWWQPRIDAPLAFLWSVEGPFSNGRNDNLGGTDEIVHLWILFSSYLIQVYSLSKWWLEAVILFCFCLPPEGQEVVNLVLLVLLLGIISFFFHWACLQTSNKILLDYWGYFL